MPPFNSGEVWWSCGYGSEKTMYLQENIVLFFCIKKLPYISKEVFIVRKKIFFTLLLEERRWQNELISLCH